MTDSSSKLLQIQGKPEQKKTILNPYYFNHLWFTPSASTFLGLVKPQTSFAVAEVWTLRGGSPN